MIVIRKVSVLALMATLLMAACQPQVVEVVKEVPVVEKEVEIVEVEVEKVVEKIIEVEVPEKKVDAHTGPPTKVRIGIIPFQDFYPYVFAEEKGWFDEEGLDVEFVDFTFWPDSTLALAAGEVDLAPQEVAGLLPMAGQVPNARLLVPVHVFDNGFALMARPDETETFDELMLKHGGDIAKSEADAAAQMSGKTIVTTAHTDMEVGVYAAATYLGGLDYLNDITIIDMNPDEGLAAFLAGEGDMYIGGIPHRLRALKEGYPEHITGMHLGPGATPLVGQAVTQEFMDENYDALLRVFRVWNRTSRYAAETPENHLEMAVFITGMLNEKTGAQMVPSDFKKMFNNWQHFPPTVTDWKMWYERITPRHRWDVAAELFVDVKGTTSEKPDFDTFILMDQFLDDYEAKYGPNE